MGDFNYNIVINMLYKLGNNIFGYFKIVFK